MPRDTTKEQHVPCGKTMSSTGRIDPPVFCFAVGSELLGVGLRLLRLAWGDAKSG